jgi:hypothetical protein
MPLQLALFSDLPEKSRSPRLRRAWKCVVNSQNKCVQLTLDFLSTIRDSVADFEDEEFTHRVVTATEAKPLKVKAPASVFGLATNPVKFRFQPAGKPAITKVERKDGLVRCVRILEQETDEWKEREAARRARQVLPKPPKGAKTISKKLRALESGQE